MGYFWGVTTVLLIMHRVVPTCRDGAAGGTPALPRVGRFLVGRSLLFASARPDDHFFDDDARWEIDAKQDALGHVFGAHHFFA